MEEVLGSDEGHSGKLAHKVVEVLQLSHVVMGAKEQQVVSGLLVAYRALGRQDADGTVQHLPLQEVIDQHSS